MGKPWFKPQKSFRRLQRGQASTYFQAWLVFATITVVAAGLQVNLPLPLVLPYWLSAIGWVLLPAAIALIVGSQYHIVKAQRRNWSRTPMITRGVYSFLRNPMCLGFVFFYFGLGLVQDLAWFFIAGLVALVTIRFLVLEREEAGQLAQYGDEFISYKEQVPPGV